jgi:zinc protease
MKHLLSLTAVACAAACSAQAAAPAAAPLPGGIVQVREVEGVREYRLPNGLQVLLVPDAGKPTLTVNVTYRVGSRMESYGETGMAHLLEHLMFKSTPSHANVGAELSKRGMSFNGSTSDDRTNYFETFPADPAQLAWALKMEAERMTRAYVSRKDLDTEMTVVRNEMEAGENDPFRALMQKTAATAYQWHNYGKDTIGARADVENVNIAHLQAFYRKYYQPDNATLIVAGKFDPATALAEIAKDFGALKKPGREIEPTWTVEPVQDGEREVTVRRVGGLQALLAVYHAPAIASPEFAAFELVNSVLGDAASGRLHQRLVQPGKAAQAFAWVTRNAEPGVMNVGAVVKKDAALDEAQALLLDTVEGLAREPITAQELARAQAQWSNGFDKVLADPQALCLQLSEAIAAGDWRLLFALRDRVAAVTPEQANAVAKAWLKPSNRTLGRFIPTEAPDRAPFAAKVPAEEGLKGFVPRQAVAAGEAFDSSPDNIQRRTEVYTLPSGLKVALLPKKTRGDAVRFILRIQHSNLERLTGHVAEADRVAPMLMMGSTHKTRAQIQDRLDALNTTWQVHSGALWGAEFALQGKRETLLPAMELLAEVVREPAFPQAELDEQVRLGLTAIEHRAADPMGVGGLALARAMSAYPAGDPRHVPSDDEAAAQLKALSRDGVAQFYRDNWGGDHADIAVVGDFDVPAAKAAIARLFGDWKAKAPYARVSQPPSSQAGLRLTATLKDKPNAIALGNLPLAIRQDDADYPALMLAAHVLGAGGFDSRLLTRLRQKDGLSYGAGANFSASSTEASGQLFFYAIFAPQNRARVEQGFAEETARFVKDGVGADELAQAKKALLAVRATQRSDDAEIARLWGEHLDEGRSFAWDAALDAKLAATSLDQVNAAIRKWIDPSRVNWSLAGDFDAAK